MTDDCKQMTDEELQAHIIELRNEQERRARLSEVPTQIQQMVESYVNDGGDVQNIIDAIPNI